MQKLKRNILPKNHTKDDFKCFGPPSSKDYDTGIYTQDFAGKKPIATYVDDCYGNIQLSAKTLAAMGIPASQTTITVEEVHNTDGDRKLVLK